MVHPGSTVGESGLSEPLEQAEHAESSTCAHDSVIQHEEAVVDALRCLADSAGRIAAVTCVSAWVRPVDSSTWMLASSVWEAGFDCPDHIGGAVKSRAERLASQLDKAHARRRAVLKRETAAPADPSSEVWCYAVPIGSPGAPCVLTIEAIGREDRLRALTPAIAVCRSTVEDAIERYFHSAQATRESTKSLDAWLVDLLAQSDETEAANRLLEASVATACADTASVMLTDPGGDLRIVAGRGLPDDVVASTRVAAGEGIAGWVLATGSSVAVDDLVHGAAGRRHGITSAMSIPLTAGGAVVGVLNVGTRSSQPQWRSEVASPLDVLAHAAADTIVALRHRVPDAASAHLPTTEEIVLRRLGAASS